MGTGAQGHQAVTIEWDGVNQLTAWRYGLATAGGVLFSSSSEGHLMALDSKTGQALWRMQTGGTISSSPPRTRRSMS